MNAHRQEGILWGWWVHVRRWVNIPNVSRSEALEIVRQHVGAEHAAAVEHWPEGLNPPILYGIDIRKCWIIRAPWRDGKDGTLLRSSRVVLVNKDTGAIDYDESGNDEG